MRGIEAWEKLHRKYNPRTMARGVRLLAEAVGPSKVKELREVGSAVNRWEEKLKVLESQFGEEIGENMRIAIFTNMLPAAVQDHIYTTIEKGTIFWIVGCTDPRSLVGNGEPTVSAVAHLMQMRS